MLLASLAIVEFDQSMLQLTGPLICQASIYMTAIGLFTAPFLGAAIAIMRLVYIKFSRTFQDLDKRKFAGSLSILSLLLGAVCGCAWVQAPKRETLVSIWLGQSQQMALALYHNEAPLETFGSPVWANLLILTTFAAQTTQFVIYLTIFKHLSDHDQSMAWLLPEGQFQKRKRSNAIDLARYGHYQVLK